MVTGMERLKTININNTPYAVIKLLGHGKGGYSYLVKRDGRQYVLKQIHHEPCAYYSFGNKIQAEQTDYRRLSEAGIKIPKMLDIDIPNERILKEYISGPTIFDLVARDEMQELYLKQIKEISEQARLAGLNIDYFPTNFVVQDEQIYYIDYECNEYSEEWNFENWGIKCWSKTPAFTKYMEEHL